MTERCKIHRLSTPDNRRRWSENDVARLLHLRDVEGLRWAEIDAALKRSKGGSQLKYGAVRSVRTEREQRSGRRHAASGRAAPSIDQVAEREQRSAAAERMTATAVFFGDPPPGYSALDRKGGNNAPRP